MLIDTPKGEWFCEPWWFGFPDSHGLQPLRSSYGEKFCEEAESQCQVQVTDFKVRKFVKSGTYYYLG